MSYEPLRPGDYTNVPQERLEHVQKVEALTRQLIGLLNESGQSSSVLLDAALNAYINAGFAFGREQECAQHMVQIGTRIAERGAGPQSPSNVH